jgi:hypothetical protein
MNFTGTIIASMLGAEETRLEHATLSCIVPSTVSENFVNWVLSMSQAVENFMVRYFYDCQGEYPTFLKS